MDRLKVILESDRFQYFIIFLIVINSITIGFETSPAIMSAAGDWLYLVDDVILVIFVVELAVKLVVYRSGFFRESWNIFDLTIVLIALFPLAGNLSILRTLRVLRTLRLLKNVPKLRIIIEALLKSIPSIGWIGVLVMIIFYIFSVIGTSLYSEQFPQWFGSIGESMFTLFQVMTLESWSSGIARPIMEVMPNAWAFFIPFILLATYTTLNIFIAIVVNTMNELHQHALDEEEKKLKEFVHEENVELQHLLEELKAQVAKIEKKMKP